MQTKDLKTQKQEHKKFLSPKMQKTLKTQKREDKKVRIR